MNEKYLKISELNNYVKSLIDSDVFLNKVYLKGEISNFKKHTRGHLYFTLKDEESRLSAVMFASSATKLLFTPEDGMNVLVTGRISCYPASGTYQIYVEKMEQDGVGDLYVLFEQLKEKLSKEGLFAEEHKRQIPKYPQRIGVVTAPTGAAIKDILSTIKRRYPLCETILFPALVQGKDAAPSIVNQIKKAQEFDLDVLIIGRGGGSIEDLWAFNEEIVARAIYESIIPTISAVGHEIDYTISDFVADLRAPTPTGAAEMAVPTILEMDNTLKHYQVRLNKAIKNLVNEKFIALRNIRNSYILKNPLSLYEIKEQKLDQLIDKVNVLYKNIISKNDIKLNNLIRHIESLNPISTLKRGYAIIKKDQKVVTDAHKLNTDDEITISMEKYAILSKVIQVKEEL
ncbi:MAG: exodeoxyribonuclease VII large subunit [Bacilli bacterium]|nr:exodeoxyribonuclease VII large subunit [Bacilli bacterium]